MARKSSLLWAIPPLIMVICGIILAVYYIQVSAFERNIFQSLTGKFSQQIETQFEGFVEPITNNLRIARQAPPTKMTVVLLRGGQTKLSGA